MSTGSIFSWDMNDVAGLINVTGGPVFVGDIVAFSIDDCDAALKGKLQQQSIPPGNQISVQFGLTLWNGHVLAINVSEI